MLAVHENHSKGWVKYIALQKSSLESVILFYWTKAQGSVFLMFHTNFKYIFLAGNHWNAIRAFG